MTKAIRLEAAYHRGMAAYWNEHPSDRDHHAALMAGLESVARAAVSADEVVVRRADLTALLKAMPDDQGWTFCFVDPDDQAIYARLLESVGLAHPYRDENSGQTEA